MPLHICWQIFTPKIYQILDKWKTDTSAMEKLTDAKRKNLPDFYYTRQYPTKIHSPLTNTAELMHACCSLLLLLLLTVLLAFAAAAHCFCCCCSLRCAHCFCCCCCYSLLLTVFAAAAAPCAVLTSKYSGCKNLVILWLGEELHSWFQTKLSNPNLTGKRI